MLLSRHFPTIQKRHQILLHHASRGFELTFTATIEQRAIATEDRDRRHAFLQRNLVFLSEIEVLIAFTNVHVHEPKTLFRNLTCFALVKRTVEHMTVVTPVGAK